RCSGMLGKRDAKPRCHCEEAKPTEQSRRSLASTLKPRYIELVGRCAPRNDSVAQRRLYQGCAMPGVLTRSVYTEVLAVRNSVFRSGPPNATLAHTSGISMIPTLLP